MNTDPMTQRGFGFALIVIGGIGFILGSLL